MPTEGLGLPPPPPPPPAPSAVESTTNNSPNAQALQQAASSLKSTQHIPKPEPVKDERSDLLAQIRLGIQLRGAEERKNQNTATIDSKKLLGGTFDVQSIMDKVQEMRRHMENSDSESDYEDDWDEDDYYS